MKYMLIGDLHGLDINSGLEDAVIAENPDVLICTGDFDQAKTIRQFMELEENLESRGKRVIKVPGNHDYSLLNHIGIDSGTFAKQGKSWFTLVEEMEKDKVAKNYLDNLVNSKDENFTTHKKAFFLDKDKFGEDYKTLVMHGAYDGDISSAEDSAPEEQDLWFRLSGKGDYEKNFKVMEEKGYKIMIRGHDHEPVYTYKDSEKGIVSYNPEQDGREYRLFKERKHIINPGALFDGWFAVIETNDHGEDAPILKYKKLRDNSIVF